MTITIELPDATVAALIDQARTEGRYASDLVAESVTERYGDKETPLEADAVEALRQGYSDIDSGRTIALETAKAEFTAEFAARFPNTSV